MDVDPDRNVVIGTRQTRSRVTKSGSDLNFARRTGAVVSVGKKTTGSNKRLGIDHQRIAKLDREDEVAPPAKIPVQVGRVIQAARQERDLSQRKLAQMINEKPSVLQDYESGKAIPNNQILTKLERILKVKLTGPNIGKKLEVPGGKSGDKSERKSGVPGEKSEDVSEGKSE